MKLSLFLAAAIILLAPTRSVPRAQTNSAATSGWTPIGLSGGGAMFTPAISPADPNRMMVNCDMSAAYVTTNGGARWQMINELQLHSSTRCRPAFHPTDPLTVFAADGDAGMKVSHDGGVNWKSIGNLPADLRGEIAIDPGNARSMLVGTGNGVFRSMDGGITWARCAGPTGEPISFHFDQTSPADRRNVFAATSEGIWRSTDSGAAWQRITDGLPSGSILGFSGGSNARMGLAILYCTVPAKADAGKYAGGIYRSKDRGSTWQAVPGSGLNREIKAFDEWAMGPVAQYPHVLTTNAQPNTVYAFNTNTGIPVPHHASVYRSEDAGNTWNSTFQADPRYAGRNVEPDYMVAADGQYYQGVLDPAIDSSDPKRLFALDGGHCYTTVDGGESWISSSAHQARGSEGSLRWLNTGLVVTTTWNYYIDPFDRDRHYICYTDIGFARSLDRGASWIWWPLKGRPEWQNTCYQLAFDPLTPGLVWGAFSNTHDIPNANIIYGGHRGDLPGGVCISRDHATTWENSSTGLPKAPVTSIVLNPRSPKGSRTLYAGLFGAGVYKSTDNGVTWSERNMGLGSDSNRRVCQLYCHPDGSLFALVTANRVNNRFVQEGVGLYRSLDGAEHWSLVNSSMPLLWPKGFTVDPGNSNTLFLSACRANGEEQSGLYRSVDAGKNWNMIGRKGPEHFGAFLSPTHPGWIYMTLTEGAPSSGLWLSKDNGLTWKPMTGLPFANAQRITFDPANPDRIYVCTFGGSVWRGPADEAL